LSGADFATIAKWLTPLDGDATWGMLAAAIRAALGEAHLAPTEAEAHGEQPPSQTILRLARQLGAKAGPEALAGALQPLRESSAAAVAGVLATELDIQTGRVETVAEWLSKTNRDAPDDVQRDHALLAGLLFELSHQPSRARELYEVARHTDAKSEAAVRAELAVSPAPERARLLINHALGLEDPRAGALLLLEAAHGDSGGDAESYTRLLKQSHERAPSLPFACWLAERRARARGEFDFIVDWLRERQKACDDPTEQAYDFVREALLIADSNLEGAKELLEAASRARPADLALRELYERLAPEPPADKAAFWAERAAAAEGADRARIALLPRSSSNETASSIAPRSWLHLVQRRGQRSRPSVRRAQRSAAGTPQLDRTLIEQARGARGGIEDRGVPTPRRPDIQSRGDTGSAIMAQVHSRRAATFLPSLAGSAQWFIPKAARTSWPRCAGLPGGRAARSDRPRSPRRAWRRDRVPGSVPVREDRFRSEPAL
jgi:hypothetical protein